LSGDRAAIRRRLAEAIEDVENVARLFRELESLTGDRIRQPASMTEAEVDAWGDAMALKQLVLAKLHEAATPYLRAKEEK
jgi:hypothetical protein